ncbi:MAG: hypothetical protein AB7V42_01485 [Thermoleophilia bacterium]
MSNRDRTPHVRHHPARAHHPEAREETVARAVAEADEAQELDARLEGADPTTRRGVNRRVTRRAAAIALAGAVAGALIALGLGLTSDSLGVDGPLAMAGFMLILAFAGAIIGGVVGALLLLEREDGRVERHVERVTGRR